MTLFRLSPDPSPNKTRSTPVGFNLRRDDTISPAYSAAVSEMQLSPLSSSYDEALTGLIQHELMYKEPLSFSEKPNCTQIFSAFAAAQMVAISGLLRATLCALYL